MPGKKKPGPSVKDDKTYEALRDEGASKEKAARIANAGAQKGRSRSSVGAKGGKAGSYGEWKVADLRKRAKEPACPATRARRGPSSSRCCGTTDALDVRETAIDERPDGPFAGNPFAGNSPGPLTSRAHATVMKPADVVACFDFCQRAARGHRGGGAAGSLVPTPGQQRTVAPTVRVAVELPCHRAAATIPTTPWRPHCSAAIRRQPPGSRCITLRTRSRTRGCRAR